MRRMSELPVMAHVLLALVAVMPGCDDDSSPDEDETSTPATEATSTPASAPSNATDTWDPGTDDYGIFVRNNTTTDYALSSISVVSTASSCSSSEYKFPEGTSVTASASKVVEPVNVDSSDCRTSSSKWKFTLTKAGCSASSYTFQVRGDGAISDNNGTTFYSVGTTVSKSFCGVNLNVNMYGRSSLYESGLYITLGTNEYGQLEPTRDPSNANKLAVVAYNTYMGTNSKPEECDRSEYMKSVLANLDTDVLVLSEMNLRESGCFDGMELAAYLWTGDDSADGDDWIELDAYDYADSTDGSGSSPNGNTLYSGADGAFPYISQWVSGIAVDGKEWQTGGDVILSKYPLEMLENDTYSDVSGDEEQKGFITAKITKTAGGQSKDYYIIATHTYKSGTTRDNQIAEIETYLATTTDIPSGARVIVTGDMNTNGQAGELDELGIAARGYPNQINTNYYPYSRDSTINFYHNDGSQETIDWVQPSVCGNDFTPPSSFDWYVLPMRSVSFKFAELSDHFAVAGLFTWANSGTPPTACDVGISSSGSARTGTYTYYDKEGTSEVTASSQYRWYRATDSAGADKAAISGATSKTYTTTSSDTGKYITFCISPSDGTYTGVEFCAPWNLI